MGIYKWVGFVILAFSLTSCLPNENDNNKVEETEAGAQVNSFHEFVSSFNTMQLPYYLPSPDVAKNSISIDKETINKYLSNKSLSAAFGTENRVPHITENIDNAEYFYDSRLGNTASYTGLVIRKKTGSNYYYLCTFSPEGNFIDGMCIAFTADKTMGEIERTASINDDLSIQIRQQSETATKENSAQTRFFEITPEGKITGIQLGI